MQEFRREQQDPATDVDAFPVVFLPADLAGLDGDDGAVGRIEHFHPVREVLREVALDEQAIDPVAVQAGADGRHLVIVDDADQRMQDGCAQIAGVVVGGGDVQDVFHIGYKGRNISVYLQISALLVYI